jgi:hypothetical protein
MGSRNAVPAASPRIPILRIALLLEAQPLQKAIQSQRVTIDQARRMLQLWWLALVERALLVATLHHTLNQSPVVGFPQTELKSPVFCFCFVMFPCRDFVRPGLPQLFWKWSPPFFKVKIVRICFINL